MCLGVYSPGVLLVGKCTGTCHKCDSTRCVAYIPPPPVWQSRTHLSNSFRGTPLLESWSVSLPGLHISNTIMSRQIGWALSGPCPAVRLGPQLGIQVGNTQFFRSKTCIVKEFWHFCSYLYRVTNFLPKLVTCCYFLWKNQIEFPFLVFPYFRVMPAGSTAGDSGSGQGGLRSQTASCPAVLLDP